MLPPGIDVRKPQRSHSELSRVEPLSGLHAVFFSVYLSGLPIRLSVFTQTLSDLTLDWSKVRSDKRLCVNTALTRYFSILFLNMLTLLACIHSADNLFHTLTVLWENEYFL